MVFIRAIPMLSKHHQLVMQPMNLVHIESSQCVEVVSEQPTEAKLLFRRWRLDNLRLPSLVTSNLFLYTMIEGVSEVTSQISLSCSYIYILCCNSKSSLVHEDKLLTHSIVTCTYHCKQLASKPRYILYIHIWFMDERVQVLSWIPIWTRSKAQEFTGCQKRCLIEAYANRDTTVNHLSLKHDKIKGRSNSRHEKDRWLPHF